MRVTVKSQPLEIDLDEKTIAVKVAEAAKVELARGIRSVDERTKSGRQKWNRSGRLVDGLHVVADGDRAAVMAPPDRLQADGMIEQLIEDVGRAAQRPADEPKVREAIGKATRETVTVKKGPL